MINAYVNKTDRIDHCSANELRIRRSPKKDQWRESGLKLEESLRSLLPGLGDGSNSVFGGWELTKPDWLKDDGAGPQSH